jgi:hypothetical protein
MRVADVLGDFISTSTKGSILSVDFRSWIVLLLRALELSDRTVEAGVESGSVLKLASDELIELAGVLEREERSTRVGGWNIELDRPIFLVVLPIGGVTLSSRSTL